MLDRRVGAEWVTPPRTRPQPIIVKWPRRLQWARRLAPSHVADSTSCDVWVTLRADDVKKKKKKERNAEAEFPAAPHVSGMVTISSRRRSLAVCPLLLSAASRTCLRWIGERASISGLSATPASSLVSTNFHMLRPFGFQKINVCDIFSSVLRCFIFLAVCATSSKQSLSLFLAVFFFAKQKVQSSFSIEAKRSQELLDKLEM